MSPTDTPSLPESIARLRREIQRLTDEQSEALKKATFVGMSPDDARACDERRNQITRLQQQLALLQPE